MTMTPATPMSATAAKPMARCVPRTVFRVLVVDGQTAERTVLGQLIRRNPSLQIAGEARTAEQALAMLGAETARPTSSACRGCSTTATMAAGRSSTRSAGAAPMPGS